MQGSAPNAKNPQALWACWEELFFIKEEIYNFGRKFLGGNLKKNLKFLFSITDFFWKYLGEIVLDFFGNIREEFFAMFYKTIVYKFIFKHKVQSD